MSEGGARVRKRSVRIAGHRTSVSLEDAFWRELALLAQQRGQSVNALIAAIDAGRDGNLSSAIRVFVLEEAKRATAARSSQDSHNRTILLQT